MKRKNLALLSILILTALLLRLPQFLVSAKQLPAVSASELISGVNYLRTANGLNALSADSLLMISAQSHSEYQASLGYWTHEGPGGTNETDRAAAVGYGGGESVKCDEAVAYASANKDVNYIIYDLWGDYSHRDLVLLNSSYIHIGAGVAEGSDGLYYYTVDLCTTSGQSVTYPTTTAGDDGGDQTVYNAPTSTYAPLTTATPIEDGSIWHLVKAGETLFDISVAYGVSILDIETMNGISPAYQRIYEGQLLLIKVAPTATATPTETATPKPPTRTPRPTRTPLPTRLTSTPKNTATVTPTATPVPAYYQALDQFSQRQWGMIIIGVSALGILLLFGRELRRLRLPIKKKEKAPETTEEDALESQQDEMDMETELEEESPPDEPTDEKSQNASDENREEEA